MTKADRVYVTPPLSTSANQPQSDDELGIIWWNSLSKQERAKWSAAAGNTGRAKDAWEAFKRARVLGTPSTNMLISQDQPADAPSRRRFLSQAASAAAGGAAMIGAAIPPAMAFASPADDSALLELEPRKFSMLGGPPRA
jgi:hypothetical protein